MDIQKLDPNFAVKDAAADLLWYDARRLTIEGKGWNDTEVFYDRLPARAQGKVPDPVWQLSRHSAGICIRFASESPTIAARWKLRFEPLAMPHMPATGVSGVDLYVEHRGKWRWVAIGIPTAAMSSATLLSGLKRRTRQYMLYLPLYNGVESLEIGVASDASLAPLAPRSDRRPIIFYGTSVVQGGCASRSGMVHTAILGRWLDRPVINLGFSGNGKMELALADLLGEIDAAAYVLDCLPNMTGDLVRERAVDFVRRLRGVRPATPLVWVEHLTYQQAHLVKVNAAKTDTCNAAGREACAKLVAEGVQGLHLVQGRKLYGSDWEATVDGAHATDLGFLRIAKAEWPVLRQVLGPTSAGA
jgi:hypothetical protein